MACAVFCLCGIIHVSPFSDVPKTLGKSCRIAHAVLDDDERCATKKNYNRYISCVKHLMIIENICPIKTIGGITYVP